MKRFVTAFGAWADRGDLNPVDIGRFRVFYAIAALSLVPNFTWIAGYPDSFYDAPAGPFQLFSGAPDALFFTVLQGALVASLVFLGLGLFTTVFSIVVPVLFMIGFGFSYSFGKIDHSFLIVLTALLMGATGWGRAVSIDALRARRDSGLTATEIPSAGGVRQWPARLFAYLIGLAFLTSVLPKLLAGWLSFDSQAALGFVARRVVMENDAILGSFATTFVQWRLPWEALDWGTLIVEGGLVIAVLSWRSWRIWLALLCMFHLGVALTLNIWFIINIMAYASFVKWSLVPLPQAVTTGLGDWLGTGRRWVWVAPALAVVVTALELNFGNYRWLSGPVIVVVASIVAIGYLGYQALALVRLLAARRSAARASA